MFGVIFSVVLVRVVFSSRKELHQAQEALARGDEDGALIHFRRAAKWYAPGNPYCTQALTELASLAQKREEEHRIEDALFAWRAVRGSILSTRSSFVPHQRRLEQANQRIADLTATLDPPAIDAGKTPNEIREEHLVLLEDIPAPHRGWTLVLLVGFLTWMISAFLFTTQAFDENDRFLKPQAMRFGSFMVLGFIAFAIGLSFA